ncbi:MAG: Rieske (2Fe-2S) protein [Anaerolineales bacterium]|nr:MAG: Rieske (2Fe-2S) protein [Anaerolineales bacterium]
MARGTLKDIGQAFGGNAMSEDRLIEGKTISRRRFFLYAWAVSVVAVMGEAVGMLFKFIQPRVQEGAFGGKITAGKMEEFPLGSVTSIKEGRFFISHLEGGFLALYSKCPHLGCLAPWIEGEGQFNCPCHGALFNEKGELLSGPSPRPLDLFPLEIVEGEIVVDTSTPILRKQFEESQLVS